MYVYSLFSFEFIFKVVKINKCKEFRGNVTKLGDQFIFDSYSICKF